MEGRCTGAVRGLCIFCIFRSLRVMKEYLFITLTEKGIYYIMFLNIQPEVQAIKLQKGKIIWKRHHYTTESSDARR